MITHSSVGHDTATAMHSCWSLFPEEFKWQKISLWLAAVTNTRPHPYQSRAVEGLISSCHDGRLAADFIINQSIMSPNSSTLKALIKDLPVLYHPVGPRWPFVARPGPQGHGLEVVVIFSCLLFLHIVLLPPFLSSTWKQTESMLVWSQALTWIFDQWLVPLKGLFQHCSSRHPP